MMAAPYSGRVIDYLGSGLLAARPAAPNLFPDTVGLYYCTDVGSEKLTAWDGAVWADIAGGGGGMTNPMTTAEDIIVGGVAGAPARLAVGADGTFLGVVSGALGYVAAPTGRSVVTPVTSAAGVVTLDYALGDYFTLTLSENVTSWVIDNPPGSGNGFSLMVEITQGAGPYTVADPGTSPSGSPITVSTGSGDVDVLAITSFNNGATLRCNLANDYT